MMCIRRLLQWGWLESGMFVSEDFVFAPGYWDHRLPVNEEEILEWSHSGNQPAWIPVARECSGPDRVEVKSEKAAEILGQNTSLYCASVSAATKESRMGCPKMFPE